MSHGRILSMVKEAKIEVENDNSCSVKNDSSSEFSESDDGNAQDQEVNQHQKDSLKED